MSDKSLSTPAAAVIEVIRGALVVAKESLPPHELHLVRETLAEHLRALGACEHSLAEVE